jgi:hypothetical protein
MNYPRLFIPLYTSNATIVFLLWIFSIIFISMYKPCSYGTTCQFTTINETCSLSVDNKTMIIDKFTASPAALYACYNNSTITCYYSRVADTSGNVLGDLYQDRCKANGWTYAVTTLIFLSIVVVTTFGYHISGCRKNKTADNGV